MRKEREFEYVGDPVPKIDLRENAAFLLQLQKSMLLSLAKRELLSSSQIERIMEKLELQYKKKK